MKMDLSKIKEWLNTYVLSKIKPDKPLTEEEKRNRAKFIVYPAFVLLFLGCIWLIYPLSDKKDRDGAGFNIEMPSPEKQDMQGNKVDAYEQAEMVAKEKRRKDTFEEMVSLFDKQKKEEPVRLPDVKDDAAKTNAGQSSVEAYRNMNRTLGNVYTSTNDPEKEALRRRVEELERQQQPPQAVTENNTMEEKMAIMEKSYELAAKYNGNQPIAESESKERQTEARPVRKLQHQVVSSLARPMEEAHVGERNTGFHTPVGKVLTSEKNTIQAEVYGTQTLSDGQALRIRLLEPMVVDDRFIPNGTVVTGDARIQGERMNIVIRTVEYKGLILPVELDVYDADGQQGILVPGSLEYDAAREIAANMGGSLGSSINITTNAGAEIASDLGKGVIQGVSQYITKKMRNVKITLKAGHKLLLYSPEQ